MLCGCIVEGLYGVYFEYQSVIGIESPNFLPRKRVWLPPGPKRGGGKTSSLAGEGVGGLNSDDWT